MYPKCPYSPESTCKNFTICRYTTRMNIDRGYQYEKACLVVLSITDQMIETETSSRVEAFVSES